MSDTKELNWFPVDESTLKGEVAKKLVALRKAQKASSEAKVAFEAEFIKATRVAEMIKPEESLAFGYRFGKLAVAKTAVGDRKTAASTKPKFSF
tara:strand:+ start:61 stop:342 length:282 start_codon:yes stop_codon:yes gene_type:complete